MKAFRNALVYVEGEGLKRCDLVFDRKIEAIGGESKELFPTDAAEYRRQERTEEKPAEPSPLPLWQKIGAWIPGLVVLLHVYLCDQD